MLPDTEFRLSQTGVALQSWKVTTHCSLYEEMCSRCQKRQANTARGHCLRASWHTLGMPRTEEQTVGALSHLSPYSVLLPRFRATGFLSCTLMPSSELLTTPLSEPRPEDVAATTRLRADEDSPQQAHFRW